MEEKASELRRSLPFDPTFETSNKKMVKALIDGTKLDNLHSRPLKECIYSIWEDHQFAYGHCTLDEDMLQLMQFVHARLHPELRSWVEEPTDDDIDAWTTNAQKKCDIIREKLYEDIELGVLSLPKCCATRKCDGAEERIARIGPWNSKRDEWGVRRRCRV
jgi:hypothetical protein